MDRPSSRRGSWPVADSESHGTFLNGWKEIAAYLGRGVRTVQRWEHLGLPVRRPNSRLRSAVVSTTHEIDSWLATCGDGRYLRSVRPSREVDLVMLQRNIESLRVQVESLRTENKLLRRQVEALRAPQELIDKPRVAPHEAA